METNNNDISSHYEEELQQQYERSPNVAIVLFAAIMAVLCGAAAVTAPKIGFLGEFQLPLAIVHTLCLFAFVLNGGISWALFVLKFHPRFFAFGLIMGLIALFIVSATAATLVSLIL